MIPMKIFFLSLLLAMCALVCSCIDGEEEIFLNADGSGSVKVEYRVPALMISEEDARALEESINVGVVGNPHLELVTNEVVLDEGYRVIRIEVKSDNVMALKKQRGNKDPEVSSGLLNTIVGKITADVEGSSARIRRGVDLAPVLDGKGSPAMLGESEFRYILHLPKAAKEHNAHEVSNEGKTLHWTYKLADTKSKPIELTVLAPLPIPWWVYLVAGILCLLIGVAIIYYFKKCRL